MTRRIHAMKKIHASSLLKFLTRTVLALGGVILWQSSANAAPQLTITPITWNILGLDSNNVNVGPNVYMVGARVCNIGDTAATNVSATFVRDGATNPYINLQGNSTLTVASLAPGSTSAANTRPPTAYGAIPNNCTDFYYNVEVTRSSAAYNAKQQYHIAATADGVGVISTPTNRELYVEKLVSQNRNAVQTFSGTTSVVVGGVYTYTVTGKTATGGYEQLVFSPNFPNAMFQVLKVEATYTTPSGARNNSVYADACGWTNDISSSTYHNNLECTDTSIPDGYSGGKAGNEISTTYTVKVIAPGTANVSNVVYDFSGSSYHYNSDFGTGVNVLTITATNPSVTISGKVWDDANGDGTQAATGELGTNAGSLNAILADSSGQVMATTPIAANGTYTFNNIVANQNNLTVRLSTTPGTVGSTAPAVSVPAGWTNTTALTTPAFNLGIGNITDKDFGIEQLPNTNDVNAPSQTNPGGATTVQVSTLSGTDPEDGTLSSGKSFKIVTLPTNGTLYYNGTAVTAGQTISNYDLTKLMLDPNDGAVTVSFTYASVDIAGKEDPTPATVTMPFSSLPTLSISGTLYQDTDGGDDWDVGELTLPANISVKLLDSTGTTTIAATTTNASGQYTFTGVANGNYKVQVDTSDSDIPVGLSLGTSNNLALSVFGTPVTGQNFGFDMTATALGYKSVKLTNDADSSASLTPDDTITWSVTYINTSTIDIPNFQVTDAFSSGITLAGTPTVIASGIGQVTPTVNNGFNGNTTTSLFSAPVTLKAGGILTVNIPTLLSAASGNTIQSNQATGKGTNLPATGILTDNIDNTSINLPVGVTVSLGSINQTQTSNIDPTTVNVGTASVVSGYKSVKLTNDADSSATVTAGDGLTWTVTYTNTGTVDIPNFQVTDALPSGMTVAGTLAIAALGVGQTTPTVNSSYNGTGNNTLFNSNVTLKAGGTIAINIPVTINAGATGTKANQATATGSNLPASGIKTDNIDNTNVSLPGGITVTPGSITQTQSATIDPTAVIVNTPVTGLALGFKSVKLTQDLDVSGGPTPGDILNWTISYTNTGTVDIRNFQITDALAAGLSAGGTPIISASGLAQVTPIANSAYNGVGNNALFNTAIDLKAGSSVTVNLPVRIDANVAVNTLTNQAVGSGSNLPPVNTDNIDNTTPSLPLGVSVPSGSIAQTQNPGIDPTSLQLGFPISGTLYQDSDGGDDFDTGEPTLPANISVKLLDSTGTTTIAATTTNASGQYTFTGVANGNYKVQVDTSDSDIPVGLSLGTSNNLAVSVFNTPVTDQNFGFDATSAATAKLLLVKRITAINGVNLIGFIDDPNTTDDNESNWPVPAATYLRGAIDGGVVQPGDEVEYTIYFLSQGSTDITNVNICDLVPSNTTFIPSAFNNSTPRDGSLPEADLGIALALNSVSLPITPTMYLSNAADGDRGEFFLPGKTPPVACSGSNDNGAVVVNVVKSPTTLPHATASGTPSNSYGFIRFRARVK